MRNVSANRLPATTQATFNSFIGGPETLVNETSIYCSGGGGGSGEGTYLE